MVPPGRVLDLIEAIEISAEKFDFPFTLSQQILITKLRRKATQGLHITDECWDSLCELFNTVEGRYQNFENEAISSSRMLVLYGILPAFLIIIGLMFLGVHLLMGAIK